ncbi:hypothetical protein EDD11_001503 [Mortierella claussenii]|nr:hypothetical protein EDD11_001503 [Mortierella claussenii]
MGTSWLARALLTATFLAATTQGACISLAKSVACPYYSNFSVDTSIATTVKSYSIKMQAFTTVEEFDKAVFNATGFQTADDCTGYNASIHIPYQNTLLCTIAVQDDNSAKCKGTPSSGSGAMCASSCTLYQEGLSAMVAARCPKAPKALSQLKEVTTICKRTQPTEWQGLHDISASCVDSLKNEAAFCGLGSLTDKCTFCKTNSTNTCCSDAVAKCPTTTTAATTTTNFIAPPTVTQAGGSAPTTEKTGLSAGAMGGIIAGSVVGILLISVALCMCWRRSNRHEPTKGAVLARQMSNSSGRYNISSPKLQEEGHVAATPIPMTTLPPIKTEPTSFGFGAATAAAGAGAAIGAGATTIVGREAVGKQSYCQALYPYQASMADELDLTPGDIVNVQRVFDDGWAVGVNMNTSNEGAFPVVCVMFVDESALDDDFEDVNMHSMAPMTLREEDEQGRRSPSAGGRNSPRSSLPSRSSSPVHLPRRNSSIRDSAVIVPGTNPMTSSPLAGNQNNNGQQAGPGRLTPPVMRDTMLSDASSVNRW